MPALLWKPWFKRQQNKKTRLDAIWRAHATRDGHSLQLKPGDSVDYHHHVKSKLGNKDESRWRGPAEIISMERRAGSAIVKHQGQPLIIPLRHLRRHILTEHFITEFNKMDDNKRLDLHIMATSK